MAEIKLENWASAKKAAAAAVAIEPTNVKALFRRGTASARSGSLEDAAVDLQKCLVKCQRGRIVCERSVKFGYIRALHRALLSSPVEPRTSPSLSVSPRSAFRFVLTLRPAFKPPS
jgi:hypothetical protein